MPDPTGAAERRCPECGGNLVFGKTHRGWCSAPVRELNKRAEAAEQRVAELEATVHWYGAALADIESEAKGLVTEDRLKLNSRLRNVIVLARTALEKKGDGAG